MRRAEGTRIVGQSEQMNGPVDRTRARAPEECGYGRAHAGDRVDAAGYFLDVYPRVADLYHFLDLLYWKFAATGGNRACGIYLEEAAQ
jgi:hypothetical protein